MSAPRWIIGVDIGGTNLVVGAVPAQGGQARAVVRKPTESKRGATFVVDRVAGMIKTVIAQIEAETGDDRSSIAGIGIGCPGPLDRGSGTIIKTPNLGWENFPLLSLLTSATGLPATLDNDANCATYGEWWQGAGRGADILVGVTIGTGIGGGLVIGGDIFHGANDVAGEIGHMTIDFTGRRCACGNEGCLEAYVSGPNIAARAVEGIEAGVESILADLVDGELDRVTAQTVYEGAARGDSHANEVIAETAKILGAGIANLINLLNPQVVVVAGGVTQAGDHLFTPLRAAVRRRAFRVAADVCEIRPAELPDTAGVVGAAGVFKREVLDAAGSDRS
jgi:glucokinase